MRKLVAVLAVVVLLSLAHVGYAVDLEAGWYVKLGPADLYGWDQTGTKLVEWDFSGGLGTSGPFQVTSPDPWWPQRLVSVPLQANDVASGTSVYLWGAPQSPVDFVVREITFHWETNYDATRMRLEMLMYHVDHGYSLLWSQDQSGYNWGIHNVLEFPQSIPIGYQPVFRVTVVPEPCGVGLLLTGLATLIVPSRRRRR